MSVSGCGGHKTTVGDMMTMRGIVAPRTKEDEEEHLNIHDGLRDRMGGSNGIRSRRGCVVDGQTTKVGKK